MTAPAKPGPDDDEISLSDSDLEFSSEPSEQDGFGGLLRALAAPGASKDEDARRWLGQLIGGKYRLLRLIGQGGMGDVFEASGPGGEAVAVKVMSAAVARGDEARVRFQRELRAAMAIQSPHVVRVLDADGSPAQGPAFLAMELLSGLDLRASLRERGLLDPPTARRLFAQACEGLAAAHALGIVHRDLKPANLFLHEHGGEATLKICDFGIAKHLDARPPGAGATTLTQQNDVVGTLVYMSPEQLRSARDVDPRADLWSLCASLHEALSGKRPWGAASSMGEIIVAVATWRLRPLRDLAPWVPEPLAAVVDRGLRPAIDERWQDAASLAGALRSLALVPPSLSCSRLVTSRADFAALCRGRRRRRPRRGRRRRGRRRGGGEFPRGRSPAASTKMGRARGGGARCLTDHGFLGTSHRTMMRLVHCCCSWWSSTF